MKKKLQVFISSTYTDLKDERQAAVQAVLDAGHIPAGMELFKAGNKSQLETIKKWIDECDVYMLILGGRYGTVESSSGKSYTQIEYEYAISKDIPVFAVVLKDSFLLLKASIEGRDKIFEKENQEKLNGFKSFILTKIVREAEDEKDIKLAIHTTLSEFSEEYDLVGWVKGNFATSDSQLLQENNAFAKENIRLLKENENLKGQKERNSIGEFTFEELKQVFSNKVFEVPAEANEHKVAKNFDVLKLFKLTFTNFCNGLNYVNNPYNNFIFLKLAPYLIGFGLLQFEQIAGNLSQRLRISKNGMKFYALLELENNN